MKETLINFEWAAFKFNVDEALWPLRNDGREKQKKRYSKGIFKPTAAEQNIDEKMVSNTAEVQTIIIEPVDY